jgi:transposase
LYSKGVNHAIIAGKTGYSPSYVGRLISKFRKKGLAALTENNYLGNNRNMGLEEERELLNNFKVKAEKGNIVSTNEMKIAHEKKVGHRIGGGQIYRVLKQNKWRTLMPRSKHQKKASTGAIEASKN